MKNTIFTSIAFLIFFAGLKAEFIDLASLEKSYFSQNGEDGITEALLSRI